MSERKESKIKIDGAPVWLQEEIQGKTVTYIMVKEVPLQLWPKEVCNKKQLEMLTAIAKFKDKNHYPPTYRELSLETGRALNTVQNRLQELSDLGLILYEGGRMLELAGEIYLLPIPLWDGVKDVVE